MTITLSLVFCYAIFCRRPDPIFGMVDATGPAARRARCGAADCLFRGIWAGGSGHKKPLTGASLFNMASVSKQFTAFTILQLQQEGLLKLSDPVRKYIPELGTFANDITLYQLLAHTGGVRDFSPWAKSPAPQKPP